MNDDTSSHVREEHSTTSADPARCSTAERTGAEYPPAVGSELPEEDLSRVSGGLFFGPPPIWMIYLIA
jgi:hypothetical protein